MKYNWNKLLSKGEYSEVYLGENKWNHELVAIKTLSGSTSNALHIKMLKREANICKHLGRLKWYECINISPIEKIYYLATEYYDMPLYLEKGIDANELKKDIIGSIKWIHSKGIIHRDIKPDNFRIKGGKVYLIDFGMSIYESEYKEGRIKGIMGTPNYISCRIHELYCPSKVDDIISGIYVIWSLSRVLPWKEDIMEIKYKKKQYYLDEMLNNLLTLSNDEVNESVYESVGLSLRSAL